MHAWGKAYVSFARAHPGLYEATLRAPDPQNPDVQRAGNDIVNLQIISKGKITFFLSTQNKDFCKTFWKNKPNQR
ncbi:TetR-like C-terminal domain-containing protein [Laceyella putida]|uniref:TetR-like C-terminal domain-containing protein n=1 Tax=Laceyella putida TaxID=110101 RepID=A0ABW2RKI5_9BACL